MLDIKIRVVTFAVNHPAFYTSIKFFMEAWRLNSGKYYERTCFTIMLPENVDAECLSICKEIITSYPSELKQISKEISIDYQNFWPMSFLDNNLGEEVVIYCPPHTLVSNDISWIIERSHLDGVVLAPAYFDSVTLDKECGLIHKPDGRGENNADGLAMSPRWFACFPKSTRHHFLNAIPVAMKKSGFPPDGVLGFHELASYMAKTFTSVINDKQINHQIIEPCVLYELTERQPDSRHKHINYDAVSFFSIASTPENELSWRSLFHDAITVQKFLENTALTEAWLYYQRNLRHIHASYCNSATLLRRRSLFEATNSPYYIFALDYLQQSAGIRALHYLCHALNESGQEAYVTCKVTVPHLRTPVLSNKVMKQHQAAGRVPIVVYPEVIPGNPLEGKIIVRWLLNQPGHIFGDKYFSDEDLIFSYDPSYLPGGMNGEILHVPTCDLSIFNNDNNPCDDVRESVCFYANKYLANGGTLTEHVKDAVSLCQDQNLKHTEIAAILRESKLLYVYEPTALIAEALLCGCPVSVIVTDYWRNNTANYSYLTDWGVVMDDRPESVALAKKNVHNYRAFHENTVMKDAWGQIDHFVELTQTIVRTRTRSLVSESSDRKGLHQSVAEDSSQYGIRKPASTVHSDMPPSNNSALDLIRAGYSFHLIVFVPEGAIDYVSGTRLSILNQLYPYSRLTYFAHAQVPHGFELSERDAWSNISGENLIEELNRLVVEDKGSDFLIFLEAGDVIEPHALSSITQSFEMHSHWDAAFTDQDSWQTNGKFDKPFFKSDFGPDLLRAAPFIADGLLAIRRSAFLELGGLRSASYGAERLDLMLRIYENSDNCRIGHISDVLCHRHAKPTYITLTQDELNTPKRKVLQEHLAKIGTDANVEDGVMPGTFHIRYRHDGESAVSIIIPTMNGGAMLQSSVNAVVENTEFKNWELIVVDQESDDAETLTFLDYLRDFNNDAVRVISQPRSSSWPALRNAGASVARQDYLLFLSDSTQPLQSDWLDEMLGYAVQPGVGVVGAKAVGADGKVSNAGYILGLGGQPAGFHDLHEPLDAPGYFGRLQVPGNPSAVSSTCMLTKKGLFDELGGFDEQLLAAGYSDVDYCLKVGKAGQRVVWTPFALMFQQHATKPPKEAEVVDEDDETEKQRARILPGPTAQVMFDRWLDRIAFDPAYNRNLSLSLTTSESYIKGFEIETFPALTWNPDLRQAPRILAFVGGGESREEHRIIAPMRTLVNAAKIQGADTREFLSIPELARISPDVLIFQYNQQGHQPKLIESYARNSKAFRIFELDVFLSSSQLYQDNGLADTLNLSDRLVVPTEYLAHEYRKFSPEIHVVLDYIERAKWGSLTPQRLQGRRPRVGWAGSAIHEVDLAIIAEVVKVLHEEVEWVFFGLCPEGTRSMVEYHGGVVSKAYPSKLASLNLDLAISPMADTPYNHAGSHLRLLEYGALGYPVVCTDITPYHGTYPVTRIGNSAKEWIDAIREHVSDLDELARRGDALREFVNENWMLEDNLDVWLKAWLPSQI